MSKPNVETINIDPRDARSEQGAFVRVDLEGGCGLLGCGCSPEPFILVSDGTTALSVRLTREQVVALLHDKGLVLQ